MYTTTAKEYRVLMNNKVWEFEDWEESKFENFLTDLTEDQLKLCEVQIVELELEVYPQSYWQPGSTSITSEEVVESYTGYEYLESLYHPCSNRS